MEIWNSSEGSFKTEEGEMKEYRIIGKRVPRLDAREKVTGRAKYSGDIALPRMICGKVLRSPYPHARIVHIDTSKAERMPGVKAVVTRKDVPQGKETRQPHTVSKGVEAVDKVQYVGDEVAAVAAIDEALAEEALDLIEVEYEELPAVFDPEEAMRPGAPQIYDDAENNIVIDEVIERGDVEKGFREADVVVEETFTTQPVVHSHLEPIPSVASWDANGKLTVWVGSMWPFGVRLELAYTLGLPLSKVRVINCFVGGAHGNRIRMSRSTVFAAVLARKAERPVKIVNTREEEYVVGPHRMRTKMQWKLGAKKDGTITAEHVKVIGDGGARASAICQGIMIALALRSDAIYRFTNVKWELRAAWTNKTPTANFRGFGSAQPTFARESMMDILAEKLGMDTAELKLKNAIRTGDVTVHGWPINSGGLTDCIKKTTESAGWKEKRANKIFGRGIGIASMIHETDWRRTEDFLGSTALVKILPDGTINVMTGEAEYGQGGDTACGMVAAEELGVPLDHVEVTRVDTDISPYGVGPWGSRLLYFETAATRLAALDAKRQLFEIASKMLKAKVEDLEIGERKITVAGSPERTVSIAEVALIATCAKGGSTIIGKGTAVCDSEAYSKATKYYGRSVLAPYFDTVVAEVEVNTETGEVKVLSLTLALDCGKVINRMSLEGQVQGATAMGIGNTFLEERIIREGRVVNTSFADYKIPSALDLPPLEITFVESMEPSNPYGAKGGGENAGIDATAPAIANAIYDAIGIRIKDLPITPERILNALEEKRRRSERL